MLHIYAALAEKERVLIADRTRAALAQRKARCSPPATQNETESPEPRIAPEFSECGVTSGASSIPPCRARRWPRPPS
jgi:hypothetical protein